MRTLLPTTVEGWNSKKNQFMKLLQEAPEGSVMANDYANAINFCDRGVIALRKIEVKRKRIEELKARMRHRVKYAVIAISIAVILAILFFSGCQTFKGATGDSAWMLQKLSDNIQTPEK